jgi:diguanylate cyclase (GGDEF)-like protein
MSKSLAKFHFHSFANLLLNLVILGAAGYLLTTDLRETLVRDRAAEAAQSLASELRGLVRGQLSATEIISRRSEVINALRQGNLRDQQREAEAIRMQMPQARGVWLLPVSIATDRKPPPLLDEASWDFVRRAASGATATPVEFHAAHRPSEDYDLFRPVLDEDKRLLGYLLITFSRAPLQALAERHISPSAYAELHQPPAGGNSELVFAYGSREVTESAPAISVPLNPLPWTLRYWPGEGRPAILADDRLYYFFLIVVAASSLVVMSYSLYRSTVKSIQHDLKSLANMIRDVRSGTVRKDYPMELDEFASALLYLKDSGRKLIEEKAKLREMGFIDHLSQLSNRRHFELKLNEAFDARKTNGPSTLLIIDLDRFKLVNDRHGHAAGDELIVKFAKVLRNCVRQTDVLARLGGDEFCIIYTFTDLANARVLAERLRKQLPREVRLSHGIVHPLRWSGGLSEMSEADGRSDEVLVRADQALLRAKESGRNATLLNMPASAPTDRPRAVAT